MPPEEEPESRRSLWVAQVRGIICELLFSPRDETVSNIQASFSSPNLWESPRYTHTSAPRRCCIMTQTYTVSRPAVNSPEELNYDGAVQLAGASSRHFLRRRRVLDPLDLRPDMEFMEGARKRSSPWSGASPALRTQTNNLEARTMKRIGPSECFDNDFRFPPLQWLSSF